MRLNDLIDNKEYKEQLKVIQLEQLNIAEEIKNLENTQEWLEPFNDWLECRKQAKKWFSEGNLEIKRLIIKTTGSNPIIMDKKLSIQAAKPFFKIPKKCNFPVRLGLVESFRTLYASEEEMRATVSKIHQLKKLVNGTKRN